jgi:hypothetical protein
MNKSMRRHARLAPSGFAAPVDGSRPRPRRSARVHDCVVMCSQNIGENAGEPSGWPLSFSRAAVRPRGIPREDRLQSMRVAVLTCLAMLAFAGNSLLCRIALRDTRIDPASFTTLRIVSGALTLYLVVQLRRGSHPGRGSWLSAVSLIAYAGTFAFAYLSLSAATGALILFGAVQTSARGSVCEPRSGPDWRLPCQAWLASCFRGLVHLPCWGRSRCWPPESPGGSIPCAERGEETRST